MKLAVVKKRSPIYVISPCLTYAVAPMLIQLLLALFYLTPSIIFDDWLFKGGRHSSAVEFLSDVFIFCWYYGSVAQILMALGCGLLSGEFDILFEKRLNFCHHTLPCGNFYSMVFSTHHALL
ncbi:hypothetical protein COOONC_26362, partial [Cooperia oncophora]